MGLDMNLYRRRYMMTSDVWKEEARHSIKIERGGKPIDTSKVKFVIEEVGYWRKANHIHKWFVDNVQNGVDDCGTYTVSVEQLEALKKACENVLSDHSLAETLLPTTSGFFFGSTNYDKWYFEDIEHTIDVINEALSSDADSFEYSSSW